MTARRYGVGGSSATVQSKLMLQVSFIFELLRAHTRALVWLIALTQGVLWWIVPSLFYGAPPGDLPLVLAIGHEFQFGSYLGPPLAFWLAKSPTRWPGCRAFICCRRPAWLSTYWAIFELGRATVGIAHAGIAVMLMVGIVAFQPADAGIRTVDFGDGAHRVDHAAFLAGSRADQTPVLVGGRD